MWNEGEQVIDVVVVLSCAMDSGTCAQDEVKP